MRGVFVSGTGTEVGKSVVAAAICAALRARGTRVGAFKPVVTGMDEKPGEFGRDHELLAKACGGAQSPDEVAPYRYGPPVSPHYAAELAGEVVDPARLVEHARSLDRRFDALVAEGVGGLLVPLTPGYLVRDLARELALPVVIAAPPGLGTINHTLLTIEGARAVGLDVRGVVMTPWPDEPAGIERSNREIVERLAGVPVSGLARTRPASLALAGAGLPLKNWL